MVNRQSKRPAEKGFAGKMASDKKSLDRKAPNKKTFNKKTSDKKAETGADTENLDEWIRSFYKNGGAKNAKAIKTDDDLPADKWEVAGPDAAKGKAEKHGKTVARKSPAGRAALEEKRAERGGKPERTGKPERSGKPERTGKPERSEKTGRFERESRENRPVRGRSDAATAAPRRKNPCPVAAKCGGCQLLHLPYKEQLELKQQQMEEILKGICRVHTIVGMKDPLHYRNKVHAVFDHDRKGNPISGVYEAKSHRVVPVESCLIEDQKSDEIIGTIRSMLRSFKIRTYDEDTGYGFLRHVLVRRGFATGQIMVVLVTSSPVFPSRNNFIQALRAAHPEITTIVQNINDRQTSMVLGDKEHVLFGKGYIEDTLCGFTFRISSKSFYQVNPVQAEKLYEKAISVLKLTGKETVIDAYCGIGTIGIIASKQAGQVIGVELNKDAVRDAISNAKTNEISNIRFYCNDAGKLLVEMAEQGAHADAVILDPPRSGSTSEFITSVGKLSPTRVAYISCGPQSLARDLYQFRGLGYQIKEAWPFDMFPGTKEHVETLVLLEKR